jgi:hypothetical protein
MHNERTSRRVQLGAASGGRQVDVRSVHVATFVDEGAGNRASQSARAARDQCDPAFQTEVHRLFSSSFLVDCRNRRA